MCLGSFFIFVLADKVGANPCGDHNDGKTNNRDMVLGIAQSMSAEDGQDNGGQSADKTNKEPVGHGDIRKPYKVGEQIFGRSWNEEQEKEDALHFFVIF